ncbi:hypothetical protein NPIL_696621 [Nephila pilipes]|uniref:Uncharacterized protein n=1 Tax=Nephila pilipes TaxID=299642 RepID=A0A8X6N7Z8_NEPPI|nr:hypothetical protein NPIL_696621 [Nephila pilipes]
MDYHEYSTDKKKIGIQVTDKMSMHSELSHNLEPKKGKEGKEDIPFQILEEMNSEEEKSESDEIEKVYLLFGDGNIFKDEGNVNEYIKNGIIVHLQDFGYNVYEIMKNKLSCIQIHPIFLVYIDP